MDFNTETFAGSYINKFRDAMTLRDLSYGELHAVLRWNGIEPLRYEKRVKSSEKTPVYPRYKIKELLNNFPLLMNMRERIIDSRKQKPTGNDKKTEHEEPTVYHNFNNNPKYRSPEMEKASDELLRQQEVYFNESRDDELYSELFGRKVFLTEKQAQHIKESLLRDDNTRDNKKTIYLTEKQVRLIKEELDKENYIENDYDEKWKKLPISSGVFKLCKKVVDSCSSDKSNLGLMDVAEVEDASHYIAIIHGGLNGSGEWVNYLKDIIKILKGIHGSYIIDMDVDVLDDVWTLQLGFRKEQLNEGAWGVKPEQSDSYLDLSHELGEPIIKILYKKLPKYVNNPDNNDGNIYYWLGLMLDMLKVKAFDECWLYSADDTGRKDNKHKTIRELFKCANKGYEYLLTDNAKDNRQGWKNFGEYYEHLKKMHKEFKQLEDYYNMDKNKTNSADKLISESINYVDTRKVLMVVKYLDNNFVRASMSIVGADGYPTDVKIVGMKGTDGEVIRNMTAKQLFYLLQDKFKGVYGNKKKRDAFIRQTMIDWYNKKISNEGLLSKNTY